MQAFVRGFLCRRMVFRWRQCIVRLQSAARRFLCMRLLARAINSAIKCQAMWRGHIKQLAFFEVQRAVICTQAWCRRLLARLWWWRERERRRMAAEEVACRAVWERERRRRLEIEREEQRIRRLIQLGEESQVNFALHVHFRSGFLLRCFNKHCDRLFIIHRIPLNMKWTPSANLKWIGKTN